MRSWPRRLKLSSRERNRKQKDVFIRDCWCNIVGSWVKMELGCFSRGERNEHLISVFLCRIWAQLTNPLFRNSSFGGIHRMQQSGPKAEAVFQNDVNDTYARIEKRVAEIKTENSVDRETIQLVAEDPSTEIGFNIPDGPPPENLVLEGEGTENLDVEEVKKFLQLKWELYESFPDTLKKAMQTESLVEVNKVLEKMSVEDAEEIVQKMQDGGMLRFSESGVRDMTGE